MQRNDARQQKPTKNSDPAYVLVPNGEQLDSDEFQPFQPHPDFWGVQAERFRKGYTKNPIQVEHPKSTINLSKLMQESKHYFEMEDPKSRSIVCTTCEVRHGGILEARNLLRYRLEDGILYFDDKAINQKP